MLDTLTTILDATEFSSGLFYGVPAVVLAALLGLAWHAGVGRRAPVAGLAFAAGALLGLGEFFDLPQELLAGTGLVAMAGLAATFLPWSDGAGFLLSIPGALVIASADGIPDIAWMRPLVAVTIVVGGTTMGSFDDRHRTHALGSVLFPMWVAGIYLTVPDTEHLLVLVGVAIGLPLLGWPLPIASLGRAGSYAAVAVLMWSAAVDGRGRPASVVGAAACVGLLLAEPVTTLVARHEPSLSRLRGPFRVLPFAIFHGVLVFIGSRVAGIGSEPFLAAVIGASALGVAVIALTAVTRSQASSRVTGRSLERGAGSLRSEREHVSDELGTTDQQVR